MRKTVGILNACAGLFGACGVAAAAAAAHLPGGERLNAVALILLAHAAALLALAPKMLAGVAWLWLVAAALIAIGAALFSADVALLTLRGARLFPMAAPTGGSLLILGWLVVVLTGASDIWRRYP